MSTRSYAIPENVLQLCQRAAADYKLDLHSDRDLRKIADSVLQLSDYFIARPDQPTPWTEEWARLAYMFYYLPLNSARLKAVIDEIAPALPSLEIEQVIDFGAGLATFSRQLEPVLKADYRLVERSSHPSEILGRLEPELAFARWRPEIPEKSEIRRRPTLTCFSYSLTELNELPGWAYDSHALLIVEPSTQDDGRKLLQLREKLLTKDFVALAPCTHQRPCPLLHQSKSDWCHDRIHLEQPEWMKRVEEFLPMKNKTLTMSYLFVAHKKAVRMPAENPRKARVVGDMLKEKGKDRQMICRGSEREFLAWFHKHGPHEEIPRGVLIDLQEDLVKVSNELRVPKRSSTD